MMGFVGRMFVLMAVLVGVSRRLQADSVTLGALKDTSIFSNNPTNTAGGNDVMYVGKNNNGATRRSLLQFDIAASGIPAGSTVDSATLTLHINGWTGNGAFGADRTISLYRVTSDWGDGTTGSGGSSGGGGQGTVSAVDGDVSWTYRSWSSTDPVPPHLSWSTAGGDYDAVASASLVISDSPTAVQLDDSFSWTGAGMTADVQAWLDGSLNNNGWLVRETEATDGLLVRFYAKQYATTVLRPKLTIVYTPVPEPGTLTLVTLAAIVVAWQRRRRAVACGSFRKAQ